MEKGAPQRQRRPNNATGKKSGKDGGSQGAQGIKHRSAQADKDQAGRRAGKEREEEVGGRVSGRGRVREVSSDLRRKQEKPADKGGTATGRGRGTPVRGGGRGGGGRGGGGRGGEFRVRVPQKPSGTEGARGSHTERHKGLVGGRGKPVLEVKQGARRFPEMPVTTGGHSVDGRGRNQDQRRVGSTERRQGNGPRSQSTEGDKAPRVSRLGYKALEELSEQDPSVVAITLSSHPAIKEHLCETEMRPDLVALLCLVLSKAFKSKGDRGTLHHLAAIIKNSGFFRTVLPHFLVGMVSEFNPLTKAKHPQNLENILVIVKEVLTAYPASSLKAVSLVLTLLQASMNTLRASGVDIPNHLTETQQELQILVNQLEADSRTGILGSDTYSILAGGCDISEDEQDFRTMSIYPPPKEFQDHRPLLRRNLITQRYENTHIYLDTHFRLLREDYVKPLRDAVQQLVWLKTEQGMTDETLKGKRYDDVLVYFDAKLVGIECTHTGLAYTVQFDIKPLKHVRWQNSKRLLYGSLVCLSCDNFQSLLFATVSEREPKDLLKGRIRVVFTEESRLKLAGSQNQVLLMVESPAYFEAYRYVLEGLQEQREDDLPFQKYIVECNTNVQPPAYLKGRDTYDLSNIAALDAKKRMLPFRCLREEAWPKMEDVGLDESQMKALQLALTKELAIIQGPPGCGKTHVGLKIARALLTNQDLWRDGNGSSTVLVVCYTNHALDQFLEGIHKFLKNGIVRVGGRSNSEILKNFNLTVIRSSDNFKRSLPRHLRMAFKEIYNELNVEERKIQSQRERLQCSQKGILHERFLQTSMSGQHWFSLHSALVLCNDGKSSLIIEWLGLSSNFFQGRETENTQTFEDAAAEEPMEEEEDEEVIEIAEEADIIQAERIIEDDAWPKGGKDQRKKRNMVSEARKLEEMMLALNLKEREEKDETQAGQLEEGWEIQRDQMKKLQYKIKIELQKSLAMTVEEEATVSDVWTLPLVDRWKLYRLWLARYRSEIHAEVLACEETYHSAVQRLADVKRHECLFILKQATVIGMTTTGAAKYRSVLQDVGPRLVIVEEAAQVLEAHTITTLSKACQHLILIGDHQQLQPSATVYDLAKNFNLEISMFERLVRMGHPFVKLNYQHRMRPDIARLLTPHIYKQLENHSSVFNYENIKGISSNLFFVEHTHPEKSSDGKSHQNLHEAKFVVALCRYLLLQGYEPQQITILTTYSGQLQCLRGLMPASTFSGVRVHVVDKYQGEENDIILLSLVRSNSQRKVGFLAIPNRVCVALSRAKKGLYCIGNSETLRSAKLWTNILGTLQEKDQIGGALNLYCQNHPDRQIKASNDEDFKQAPEGGCTQPCQFRLDCGHACANLCHPYDPEHKKYTCKKQCQRLLCDQGHKCPLMCFKECPKHCSVKVPKVIPQCQHTQMVPCHQDPETFQCREPCQKTLECGHPCQSTCAGACTTMCQKKVTLVLKCGHSQTDPCFYQTRTMGAVCRNPCGHHLKCRHSCRGTCGKCFQGRFHVACFQQGERLLVCSHKSLQPCQGHGSPCQRPCENSCSHSSCKNTCGQPCVPCTEPCVWQCAHQRCTKLCHEPCNRPPCDEPCPKSLSCGHPCVGLCGEKCPSKCPTCNTKYFSGLVNHQEARFVQLEDCGHVIEYTAMDLHMVVDDKEESIKLKGCPKCGTAIRKNRRYGSVINKTLAEIERVKMEMNGDTGDMGQLRVALKRQCEVELGMSKIFQPFYTYISENLDECSAANNLWVLQNKMDFLRKVEQLLEKEKDMSRKQGPEFKNNIDRFVCWLNDPQQNFTDQQVYDLQRELRRLILLAAVNVSCHAADKQKQSAMVQTEIEALRKVLEQSGHFTRQDEERVKESVQAFNQKLPLLPLEISDEEMDIPSMRTPIGHWIKCPTGYVHLPRGTVEKPRCLLC